MQAKFYGKLAFHNAVSLRKIIAVFFRIIKMFKSTIYIFMLMECSDNQEVYCTGIYYFL